MQQISLIDQLSDFMKYGQERNIEYLGYTINMFKRNNNWNVGIIKDNEVIDEYMMGSQLDNAIRYSKHRVKELIVGHEIW